MTAPVTTYDMLNELRREIALRERLYPGWVAKGTLKRESAERQMEVLKAVFDRIEVTLSFAEVKKGRN